MINQYIYSSHMTTSYYYFFQREMYKNWKYRIIIPVINGSIIWLQKNVDDRIKLVCDSWFCTDEFPIFSKWWENDISDCYSWKWDLDLLLCSFFVFDFLTTFLFVFHFQFKHIILTITGTGNNHHMARCTRYNIMW